MRIRRPARDGTAVVGAGDVGAARADFVRPLPSPLASEGDNTGGRIAVNRNVLPPPGTLSAQIRPPIFSTRRRQMDSPRPVPPYWRVVDESTCVKSSKMDESLSLGMPTPVSATEKSNWSV